MTVQLTEDRNSPQMSRGDSPTATRNYTAIGTTDIAAVYTAVMSAAPLTEMVDTYLTIRNKIDVKPDDVDDTTGNGVWRIAVGYIQPERKQVQPGSPPVISWDTTGETRHIAFSIKTRSSAAADNGTPKDFGGAIAVQSQGGELTVQGCDVPAGKFAWTETHSFWENQITMAYAKSVAELTGKTNSGGWRGFEEGQVMFYGASASPKGNGVVDVSFKFAAGENEKNIAIPENNTVITLPEKKAWDYVWVFFQDKTDNNQLVRTPLYAYAEQVVKEADFGILNIGSQTSGSGSSSGSTPP